jgi:hypothetical protein
VGGEKSDLSDAFVGAVSSRDNEADSLYIRWSQLVRTYSETALTKPSDRLPALSGMAKVFPMRLKDEYLAGLWKRDLGHGLIWTAQTLDSYRRTETYRAPSWSWASVEGGVDQSRLFWGRIDRFCMKDARKDDAWSLIHVECTRAGLDPTGAVSSGFLSLSGFVVSLLLTYGFDTSGNRYNYRCERMGEGHSRFHVPSDTHIFGLKLGSSKLWNDNGDDDLGEDNGGERGVVVMVLREVKGYLGTFERIGIIMPTMVESRKWFDGVRMQVITIV